MVAQPRLPWAPAGERLIRHTIVPKRAPILAKDGTPLAEGPADARTSPLGAAATAISGSVGTPKPKQEPELAKLGFPPGTPTGTSGLELAFNQRLAGNPGGELVAVPTGGKTPSAGGRVLASSKPIPGKPVHTTIDPDLQRSAVAALGSTVRRRGRARRPHRGGPGGRGARVLRAAAAGLDVQASDDDRRAGER